MAFAQKPKRPAVQRFPQDLEKKITALQGQIATTGAQKKMKKDGATVSIGTSKTNYIDPRIIAAWCKKKDFPIGKIFTKSLLNKFPWALGIEDSYRGDRDRTQSVTRVRSRLGPEGPSRDRILGIQSGPSRDPARGPSRDRVQGVIELTGKFTRIYG
eukprot:gene18561-6012_t